MVARPPVWGGVGFLVVERLPELGVLLHAVAAAADGHDVAMVDQPINESGGQMSSPKMSPPESALNQ